MSLIHHTECICWQCCQLRRWSIRWIFHLVWVSSKLYSVPVLRFRWCGVVRFAPSFVPRRAADLEDFTLSSTSENEADNNARIEKQMAYRSDGDCRYNRDVQSFVGEQQSRPSRMEQIQASEFVRAGVRTRSQSQ